MNSAAKKIWSGKIAKSIQLMEVNENSSLHSDARTLLKEYGAYMYCDLGLIAGKETYFEELDHFPGNTYLPPSGIFVVAKIESALAGCVGVKRFDDATCEMKRLYIRSCFRGKGLGSLLCSFVMDWCRTSPYRRILLDTNLEMKEAILLYRARGFKEIEPYCINENDHPVFMEYRL